MSYPILGNFFLLGLPSGFFDFLSNFFFGRSYFGNATIPFVNFILTKLLSTICKIQISIIVFIATVKAHFVRLTIHELSLNMNKIIINLYFQIIYYLIAIFVTT